LRSSLFFPPTKNASVSRKGQADMPWPRVAVTVLCRSGRAMLSGSKSSPKRSTRTHRGTGGEDESPRACVQISDQHTLQRVCKDQRLPSRRRKKDAGERAKEGSRPPYERGVQALRAWSWKRASPLFRPGRPATWTELEGPGDLRARCSCSAPHLRCGIRRHWEAGAPSDRRPDICSLSFALSFSIPSRGSRGANGGTTPRDATVFGRLEL